MEKHYGYNLDSKCLSELVLGENGHERGLIDFYRVVT